METVCWEWEKQKSVDVRFRECKRMVAGIDVAHMVGYRDNPYRQWSKREPELVGRSAVIENLRFVPVIDAIRHLLNDGTRVMSKRRAAAVDFLRAAVSTAPTVLARKDDSMPPLPPPVEMRYVEAIMAAAPADLPWETQKTVGGYRVDLAVAVNGRKYAIEIDEGGHAAYDRGAEKKREAALRAAGYELVRINPHKPGMNEYAAAARVALLVGVRM